MAVRLIRLCLLSALLACVVYFIFALRQNDSKLPQWARVIEEVNWTHHDWPIYDLQYLKHGINGDSADHENATQNSSQTLRDNRTVLSTNATALGEPAPRLKPTLPPITHGPSPYAYAFAITSNELACAALVNIERLVNNFHTPNRIFVLVHGNITQEYLDSLKGHNVTVLQEKPPHPAGAQPSDYQGLFKLRAFWLHQLDSNLKRVLILDPDVLLLRSVDSLFELPAADLAAPRAYQDNEYSMSSALMLATLSNRVRDKVKQGVEQAKPSTNADNIINALFTTSALLLPGSYDTQTSHWDKWAMPAWFRPEEVTEMEEAGRITGSYGLVSQGTTADVARLALAVERWTDDFEDLDYGLADVHEGSLGQRARDKDPTRPTEKQRLKRQTLPDEARKSGENMLKEAQAAEMQRYAAAALAADKEDTSTSLRPEADAAPWESIPPSAGVDVIPSPETTAQAPSEASTFQAFDTQNVGQDDTSTTDSSTLTQYFSDVPVPDTPTSTSSISAPEPSSTVVDKGALDRPLYDLHRVAHVLRFGDGEKPWLRQADRFKDGHEEAHALWKEHYKQWRELAKNICPAVNRTSVSEKGEVWKLEKLVEHV